LSSQGTDAPLEEHAVAVIDTRPFFVERDPQDTVVVHVHGELDAATAPSLRLELQELIDRHGPVRVTLDLTDVTFLDSTGLSVLLGGTRRAREEGGDLIMLNPGRGLTRVFQLAGLADLFTIDRDERAP
jgi:anti-sigma B factor antagonist